MLTKRIIACLDVRGGRVVKGVQFDDMVAQATRRSWRIATQRRARTSSCCSTLRPRMRGAARCWRQCGARRRALRSLHGRRRRAHSG